MPYMFDPSRLTPTVYSEEQCWECGGTGELYGLLLPDGTHVLCGKCDGSGTIFGFIRRPTGIGQDYWQIEAPIQEVDEDVD